ncbi:thiamine phosphate synthase [Caldicellulosiruptoraceae bacterium PP1]
MTKHQKLDLFKARELYCLTCEKFSNGKNNIEVVKEMLDSGVKIIQYREKEKSQREKYYECNQIKKLTDEYNAVLIVNDHIDLCQIVDADGIHIGQNDYPIEVVKNFLGQEKIIGVTAHTKEQAILAQENGADYIGLGPIFETYTKGIYIKPRGLEFIKWANENLTIPFVAIGGIKENNLFKVIESGAKCIAMVTEIVGAYNIKEKVMKIYEIMKGLDENE